MLHLRSTMTPWLLGTVLTAGVVVATAAEAQSGRRVYALPSQPLSLALQSLAVASGRTILVPATIVEGRSAPALVGRLSVEEALDRLLVGSGLHYTRVGAGFAVTATAPETERETDRDILVTGTRIRGATAAGADVIVIDREAIDRSGYATTQQLLQALPQNFGGGPNEGSVGVSVRNNTGANSGFGSSVNLRGLGASSTLVLVDGNRPALGGLFGAFSDLSLIPSTAIERVEVLTDGASALYGSDAVAGVVNIKLRTEATEFETRARYGLANGFDEVQASQLAGVGWRTGHFTLAYEYYGRGRLRAADRAYAREDLRAFGGPDYRKTFANPGTIIAANGQTFAIPRGQDGTALSAAALVAGTSNLGDGRLGSDLLPATRRHAASATIRQDILPWLRFSAEGFFAARRSSTHSLPDNYGAFVVPVTNPFYVDPIGIRQPLRINYSFARDLGPQTATTNVRAYSGVGGLSADLGRWHADLMGSYGLQTERLRSDNIPNYAALAVALADTNRATAYNLFGDGTFTNPATIDKVRGYLTAEGRYEVYSGSIRADGPVARLPAGAIKLAVGGEYRHEYYAYDTTDLQFTLTPRYLPTNGLPAARTVSAAYGELLVPIVAPAQGVAGIDRLDVSIAGRVERYDSFGTTANPKIGVSWQPVRDLTLRATYGTSFRAPSFQETRQGKGASLYLPQALTDPASPSGKTNALILFGNEPGIGPERATTKTFGLGFRPAALPGLGIDLTVFDIAYRDRIVSVQSDYLTFLANRTRYGPLITQNPSAAVIAGYYADPSFSNPYGIAAGNIAVLIDARTNNLASSRVRGLDFDIGYRTDGPVVVEGGVSGSYLFHIDQKIIATAPTIDLVSTIGNPVDLRLRGRLLATAGRVSASSFVNFVDGYRNTALVRPEKVASYATVDLQLGYDLGRAGTAGATRVALSVTNLFDRAPPYVNNPTTFSAAGFDPDNASAIGRLVALQVTKPW
ncbi:TonB-dependent receptor [Sphingomonas sp. 1P08PE]|uniref:TonB-dependent receptor n=1 Tax=Sphingomonas sp. 1P08PE TaxID=554122 RepID=UPI00399F6B0B